VIGGRNMKKKTTEELIYECLNCGFKFINPGWKFRETRETVLLIDPIALRIPCCPKCRSDAIKKTKT